MSCRRLVEEEHYKSQDYYFDRSLLNKKNETFEFTVYEDAAGFLKVTLGLGLYIGKNFLSCKVDEVTSRNPPEEMTLEIHVKCLEYVEEADETKRMCSKSSNKITSDDFFKKNEEKFHNLFESWKYIFQV